MDSRSVTSLDEPNNDNNKSPSYLRTQPKEENETEQYFIQALNSIDKEVNSVIIRTITL